MSETATQWEYTVADIESAEELQELDADGALELIKHDDVDSSLAFDLADGLFWYCANYHGGQGSDEYRILSEMQIAPISYKPGRFSCEPANEASLHIYRLLENFHHEYYEPMPEH